MRVSELITRLQAELGLFGDVDVLIEIPDLYSDGTARRYDVWWARDGAQYGEHNGKRRVFVIVADECELNGERA